MPVVTNPGYVGPALGAGLLGAGLLANGLRRRARRQPTSRWQPAEARVSAAGVSAVNDLLGPGHGTHYAPEVKYEYEVDGRRYWGVIERARVPNPRGAALLIAVEEAYPIGRPVEVLYDPAAPERSVPAEHVEVTSGGMIQFGILLLATAVGFGIAAFARS